MEQWEDCYDYFAFLQESKWNYHQDPKSDAAKYPNAPTKRKDPNCAQLEIPTPNKSISSEGKGNAK